MTDSTTYLLMYIGVLALQELLVWLGFADGFTMFERYVIVSLFVLVALTADILGEVSNHE